jgi:hypothetical protein
MRTKTVDSSVALQGPLSREFASVMDGGTAPPGRTSRVENLQVDDGRDLDESHEDGTRTDDNTHPRPPVVGPRQSVASCPRTPSRPAPGRVPANGRSRRPFATSIASPPSSMERATRQRGRGRRTGCRERAFTGTPLGAGITTLPGRLCGSQAARSRTRNSASRRDRPRSPRPALR